MKKLISIIMGFLWTCSMAFAYGQDATHGAYFSNPWEWEGSFLFHGHGIVWALLVILFSCFAHGTISFFEKRKMVNTLRKIPLILLSLLFGLLNTLGLMMYYLDKLPFFHSLKWVTAFFLMLVSFSSLFEMIALWVLWFCNWIVEPKQPSKIKHAWCFSFFIIIACWLPWIIAYYPASMDWDVYVQLSSYLGISSYAYTNHHPWIVSCILGCFYKIGLLLDNPNVGIFLYVFIRDVIIAAIFAQCCKRISEINKGLFVITLIFYAITPVWGAYAKHAFKDTLAAGIFCGYLLSLNNVIFYLRTKDKVEYSDAYFYSLMCLLACFSRGNVVYAVLPISLILCFVLLRKKKMLINCCVIAIAFVLYFGYNYYIIHYGGIKPSSSREALSIPFQQTARTVKYHGDTITDVEKEAIDKYLEYDSMAEEYNPILADPIKDRCKENQNGDNARREYLITWAKMLFKYPDTYIEAFVGQSYGYYSFVPRQQIGAGNWNSGMCIFNWIEVEAFDKYGYGFHYIDSLQPIRETLDKWWKIWDWFPFASITDTIAIYTWLIAIMAIFLIMRKEWLLLLPVLSAIIIILTCIASPVNDCFRYYSLVAASMPAILCTVLHKRTNKLN